MLYFISLGLNDEKDISIKGLEAAKECEMLFAEFYTTKLQTTKEKIEKLIGKKIKVLSRKDLEENFQDILNLAKNKKVGLLVGGDAFIATTHLALKLEAMKQGIETKVIHSSSIISAIGETGLHIYKFGPCVTIPFPEKTKGKLPESVYEVIKMNKARGLHTLCLLDIEDEKLMKINEGIKILLEIEERRKENVLSLESEILVFVNAGSEKPLIAFGKVKEIIEKNFEEVPAVIIVPGLLHFTEKEFLEFFRI
ncbi:MAG: diphthine synthase [Candidatus Aenigmatarchaeota archaeon]